MAHDGRTPDTREDAAAMLPALHVLMAMGWEYLPPAECLALRGSERAVLLEPVLRERLQRHRFEHKGKTFPLSPAGIDHVIRELSAVRRGDGPGEANRKIHQHLTLGITVTEFVEGRKAPVTVPLIDWADIGANRFQVTEELSVARAGNRGRYRPDIAAYVNGIPLAVIEAKRPVSSQSGKAMVAEGISQHLRNQMEDGIPDLYAFSQILLSVSGAEGRYATAGTPKKFWALWREEEIAEEEIRKIKAARLSEDRKRAMFANRPKRARERFEALHDGFVMPTEQDRLIAGLLRPDRLLDMTRRFVFFDGKLGKIVARYQQVQGVKAILDQVRKRRADGGREGGVTWHTTGSGKSKLMVLFCRALLLDRDLAECRIVVVTDRLDLEKQLAANFITGGAFGAEAATRKDGAKAKAESGRDLARRIAAGTDRIVFTTLQRFGSATRLRECRNDSDKLIVLVDEGHRSHGGENHERMRKALPNAACIAFTGTPLLKDDKTRNKFGPILHAYTMQQAVADGATAPLVYEERKPALTIDKAAIDAWFDKITKGLTEEQKGDLKKKFATRKHVYGAAGRIELIAWDIAAHFRENLAALTPGLKAQLAADSKLSAIRYKEALDATGMVTSAVVISAPDSREGHRNADESGQPEVQQWWKKNAGDDPQGHEARTIAAFATEGAPEILIVVDKLLTGFDEPRNTVLYIDKPLKGHNLIQAISRVNRLHDSKQCGILIDYRGILAELDISIREYQNLAEQTRAGYDAEDLVGMISNVSTEYKRLPALHKALWDIFADVKNEQDYEQLRRVLIPDHAEGETGVPFDRNQETREDFYEALTAFGLCLKLALSSRAFFEDEGFSEDTIREYKRDLKFFSELRVQAMQDARETVEFSDYEDPIRRLVDRQVIGREIDESGGVFRIDNLPPPGGPETWAEEKARTEADLIKARIRKTINVDLAEDPYARKTFSELLEQAIRDAEERFDHPKDQFLLLSDLEKQVEAGVAPDIPARLADKPKARAFFGAFLLELDRSVITALGEDALVEEAEHAERIAIDAARTHSINPENIENEIRRALLPRLFELLDGVEPANAVLNRIVEIVRDGGAGR